MKTLSFPALVAGICVALGMASPALFAQSAPTPPLRIFVEAALGSHPDIAAANARVKQAEALADASSQPLYNPELALDYEDTDETEKTLGLSQAIDWNGKRRARGAAGSATAQSESALAEAAREAFIGNVLSSLGRQRTLAELADLSERRQALMQRFKTIAQQRHSAGDLPRVDLDLAILAATQARFERARSVSSLAEAREDLRALAAPGSTSSPLLPAELPPIPKRMRETRSLPAIRAAQYQLESAEARLDLATRERRPDPVLSARAGKVGDEDLFGLSISIPLFVRNNFSAEVVAADAELAEASANLASRIRARDAELARINARYREMRSAWSDWESAGQLSLDRQIKTLERLWSSGEIATSDYLIQITQALATRSSASELQGELWQAWFDWLTASATGADWLGL